VKRETGRKYQHRGKNLDKQLPASPPGLQVVPNAHNKNERTADNQIPDTYAQKIVHGIIKRKNNQTNDKPDEHPYPAKARNLAAMHLPGIDRVEQTKIPRQTQNDKDRNNGSRKRNGKQKEVMHHRYQYISIFVIIQNNSRFFQY